MEGGLFLNGNTKKMEFMTDYDLNLPDLAKIQLIK